MHQLMSISLKFCPCCFIFRFATPVNQVARYPIALRKNHPCEEENGSRISEQYDYVSAIHSCPRNESLRVPDPDGRE